MKHIITILLMLLIFSKAGATVVKDLSYIKNDNPKNKLDIYYPEGKNNKVLIFIHGGGWRDGDKSWFDYIGEFFEKKNICCIIPSYRLNPEVKYPDNAKDIAAAIKWVQENIDKYGGNKNEIYLCGHSAGSHLAADVICDEEFGIKNIKGVIGISGVYIINFFVDAGGFGKPFQGCDKIKASPSTYVKTGLPKFLLIYAQFELTSLNWQAIDFHKKLLKNNNSSELIEAKLENHFQIVENIFDDKNDYSKYLINFIKS